MCKCVLGAHSSSFSYPEKSRAEIDWNELLKWLSDSGREMLNKQVQENVLLVLQEPLSAYQSIKTSLNVFHNTSACYSDEVRVID